jgi:hypothetical protein
MGRITSLELCSCAITGPHAKWLAGGVLAHCRALVHLDLSEVGLELRLVPQTGQRVLLECWAWVSLHRLITSISTENQIEADGSESFAGVLALCSALAHLDLGIHDGSLGPCAFSLCYSSLNARHDLYLIASRWVALNYTSEVEREDWCSKA